TTAARTATAMPVRRRAYGERRRVFKGMRDAGMDAWSKTMIQLVQSDAYAQATGTMLDAWLTTSGPFRKAIETAMTQVLTAFSMPTRADVITLAERLTN